MLIITLIYAGGFLLFSSHLIYVSIYGQEQESLSPENSSNGSEQEFVDPFVDVESVAIDIIDINIDSDSDSSTYSSINTFSTNDDITEDPVRHHLSNEDWQKSTQIFPTFKSENEPEDLQSIFQPLKPKTVRFHPISTKHDTFSRTFYDRKIEDPVLFARIFYKKIDDSEEIAEELRAYKADEMIAYNNPYRPYEEQDDNLLHNYTFDDSPFLCVPCAYLNETEHFHPWYINRTRMIFAPLTIAGASVFCIFTSYCGYRTCFQSSTDSTENDWCCLKRCRSLVFEDTIPDEDLRIYPTRPVNYYSSVSDIDDGNLLDTVENIDVKIPLVCDEIGKDESEVTSTSPPELLLLPGDAAVSAYTNYLQKVFKSSQGPEVVHVQFQGHPNHSLKSKSFKEPGPDPELDLELDEFDEKYSDEFDEKYSAKRQLYLDEIIKDKKKVQFNSLKDVRHFTNENDYTE